MFITPGSTASQVALTVPVFSARTSAAQAMPTGSTAKISNFDTVDEDSAAAFVTGAGASQSRYTPKTAGLWIVTAAMSMTTAIPAGGYVDVAVYLNGAIPVPVTLGTLWRMGGNGSFGGQFGMPQMIRVNGTTDYLECFSFSSAVSQTSKYSMFGYWIAV